MYQVLQLPATHSQSGRVEQICISYEVFPEEKMKSNINKFGSKMQYMMHCVLFKVFICLYAESFKLQLR